MFSRCVYASLVAGAVIAPPATLSAQQWPPPPPPAKNTDRLPAARAQTTQPEVEELTPSQIERAQEKEVAPKAAPAPRPAAPKKAEKTATKHAPKHREPTHAVSCSGAFAKASSHAKLEGAYKAQNVAFTQVDGADGTKVMATVLFPTDPKQRLEVWWANEKTRADTYLIVINGKSAWTAPHGVKLGLALAALEKINHKPFKLKGFDKDEGSEVSDWNGGALAKLPGGCKVGVRLRADSKVAAKVREAAAGNKEFASSDATIRAVKPVIAEIILGY